jgi:hypothetical protein
VSCVRVCVCVCVRVCVCVVPSPPHSNYVPTLYPASYIFLLQSGMRVLDVFFSEGVLVLFRVGLALLKQQETKLLSFTEGIQILTLLKEELAVDCEQLIEVGSCVCVCVCVCV